MAHSQSWGVRGQHLCMSRVERIQLWRELRELFSASTALLLGERLLGLGLGLGLAGCSMAVCLGAACD